MSDMLLNIVRIANRALGAVMIILGLLFWFGIAYSLLPVHMLIGVLLVLILWGMAIAARHAAPVPRLVIAWLWGPLVVVVGILQAGWLAGNLHWIVRLIHLLIGIGLIAQTEMLARALKEQPKTGTVSRRAAAGA